MVKARAVPFCEVNRGFMQDVGTKEDTELSREDLTHRWRGLPVEFPGHCPVCWKLNVSWLRVRNRLRTPSKKTLSARSTDWTFFSETCADEGRPNKLWLFHAQSTPIQRHVKVKGDANPYDPTYETCFEEREGAHMLETLRGTRTLRYLWHEQRELCTRGNTKSLGSPAGACITLSPA